jgi:monoamine oxidase
MSTVVVVGAGLAGLTVALRLEQSGHTVIVLEARDRVGGRVHSVTMDNGAVAELGGEWITANQTPILELVDEAGLTMSDVGVDFTIRDLMGSDPIPNQEHRRVARAVSAAVDSLSTSERSQLSASQLLNSLNDGSDAFTVLRQRIEGSAGLSLDRVGVEEIVGDFGIEETTYLRIDGGNQLLADRVAEMLSDVRLGQPVVEIRHESNVSVSTKDDLVPADAVVVAVPLPLISKMKFSPPLDPEIVEATDRIKMGTAAKLAIPTKTHPQLFALQIGDLTWWLWTGAGPGEATRRAVTGFAGTQEAVSSLDGRWPDLVSEALPGVDLTGTPVFTDWGQDPWAAGCYSALGPAQEGMLEAFRRSGSVVFAGEHTLGAGSMSGAIESGEAAAIRLGSHLPRVAI